VTVIVHTAPVVLTMTGEPIPDGAVLVENDLVVAVGPRNEVIPDGVRVREWRGVMTPGLVNAHAHLEYGPPFADLATRGLPFPRWLGQLQQRREGMTDVDWQVSARGSAHQLLKSGTTAVADVVTRGPGITVAASVGLQGVSYAELAGVDDKGWPIALEWLEAILATGGRQLGVSPHTLYTLSGKVFRDLVELSRNGGMRLHLGCDFELAGTGSGSSPVQHCDDLGGLGPDVHVAHGVHVDAADRALLRARQTVVALCTRSNQVLGVGEAPVADYLTEGNPIALGTDSLASCPDLDLLAEARATRDLARRQGFERPEERLVRALTLGGAQAVGQDLGTLRPGGRADLAVFDVPTEDDPYVALVEHGPGRCLATVLSGKLVHRR
jgi:cytosine/adenosine deaminase-related metal-dependent hydrolase